MHWYAPSLITHLRYTILYYHAMNPQMEFLLYLLIFLLIICFTLRYMNSTIKVVYSDFIAKVHLYIAHYVYIHVIQCYMLFSCSFVQSSETILASVTGLNNQYQGRLPPKRKVFELKLPAVWTGHGTFKKESESLPALHVSYHIIL